MGRNSSHTAPSNHSKMKVDMFPMKSFADAMYSTDYPMLSPTSPCDLDLGWQSPLGEGSQQSYLQNTTFPSHVDGFFTTDRDSPTQSLDGGMSDCGFDQEMLGSDQFEPKDMAYSMAQRERRKAQNRANQRAYRERKTADLKRLESALSDTHLLMEAATSGKREIEKKLKNLQEDYDRICEENELLRAIAQLQKTGKGPSVSSVQCRL